MARITSRSTLGVFSANIVDNRPLLLLDVMETLFRFHHQVSEFHFIVSPPELPTPSLPPSLSLPYYYYLLCADATSYSGKSIFRRVVMPPTVQTIGEVVFPSRSSISCTVIMTRVMHSQNGVRKTLVHDLVAMGVGHGKDIHIMIAA